MLTTVPLGSFLLSVPERLVRSVAALLGGVVHETFALALPRVVHRSRLYEATAKNLLRVTIELVGGVEARIPADVEFEPDPGRLAVRKGVGNAVELGSIAAFGFSPLWILAAAADVTRGSRVYLDTFVTELVRAGALPAGSSPGSADELLGALERVSGTTARLVDIPPLELRALRQSLAEIRRDAASLPGPDDMARVYAGLLEAARRERTSLLEVSVGIGVAFFNSARHVGRQHLLDPYREDLRRIRAPRVAAVRPGRRPPLRHRPALPHRARPRPVPAGREVKRHPALVGLSDDHHHELVQARRLLAAAGGGAVDRLEAGAAYVDAFFRDTVEHFRREEETVFPLYARQPTANAELLERVLREHMELHGLARALRAEVAAGDVSGETLAELGALLRAHVRLEERELFEDLQRIVPPAQLDELE